jgi:hypothetical protein
LRMGGCVGAGAASAAWACWCWCWVLLPWWWLEVERRTWRCVAGGTSSTGLASKKPNGCMGLGGLAVGVGLRMRRSEGGGGGEEDDCPYVFL